MAFKVNYNQQRNDRDRAKQAKKDAKLREQEAELMRRRNGPQGDGPAQVDDATQADPSAPVVEEARAPHTEDKANGTP